MELLPTFMLKALLTEKVKFKQLDEVFGMLLYFGILKIRGFV